MEKMQLTADMAESTETPNHTPVAELIEASRPQLREDIFEASYEEEQN